MKKLLILTALFVAACGPQPGEENTSTGGGGHSNACYPGYCYTSGVCCPKSAPWYNNGAHGYAKGCYASCPYVGDCSSQTQCF
jgi:hypothetical protein